MCVCVRKLAHLREQSSYPVAVQDRLQRSWRHEMSSIWFHSPTDYLLFSQSRSRWPRKRAAARSRGKTITGLCVILHAQPRSNFFMLPRETTMTRDTMPLNWVDKEDRRFLGCGCPHAQNANLLYPLLKGMAEMLSGPHGLFP